MPATNSDARKRLEEAWSPAGAEYPAQVIGLSGYAQAGKDSTGQVLVNRHGFTRLAFADALRAVIYDLDPFVMAHDGGCYPLSEWAEDGFDYEWLKANSNLRDYLQKLGVAVRDHVAPDAWVNAVLRQVQPGGKYVITDVRFPNEYAAIKASHGQVWRVVRAGHQPPNQHISETALDDRTFDRILTMPDCNDDLAALEHGLNGLVAVSLEAWRLEQ